MNSSGKQYKLLLVDDDKAWSNNLKDELEMLSLEVIYEEYAENALKRISEEKPDAVLLDVLFKPKNKEEDPNKGKPTFDQIKAKYTALPVIMLTNTLAADTYVDADYPGRAFPFIKTALKSKNEQTYVAFAKKIREAIEGTENIENYIGKFEDLGLIVGNAKAMRDACRMVLKAKNTDTKVLITGESGTGKELIAKAIRNLGKRKDQPFVLFNCAALPENLIESELFGYEKGAFTGATERRLGKFELADKGTIFLDEIGEMSPNTQAKVLRILQEQRFERLGGTETLRVDVRLISATHKDLPQEIKKGKFREDLYFRLNAVHIDLPPLRERMEDIEILYKHLVNQLKTELHMENDFENDLRPQVEEKFKNYSWPGNIRELKNSIERAMHVTDSPVLMEGDFSLKGSLENIENNFGNINKIVQEILEEKHEVEDNLKLSKKNVLSKEILEGVIKQYTLITGKRPSLKDLAELFDLDSRGVAQKFKVLGVKKLTSWPEKKKP